MSNSIRLAVSSDIDDLVAMMAEDYAESGYQHDKQTSEKAFRQMLAEPSLGKAWILESDGRTAGYIVLTFGFCMEYGGRDAYADDLYVRKEFRRAGLGRLGMKSLIEECKTSNVRAINLEVEPRNSGAQRLYSELGFESNRRLLMVRRLV